MKSTWRRGDVFLVPLSDEYRGVGQIVEALATGELYVVLFNGKYKRESQPKVIDIATMEPVFASLTLDAKLWHEHWSIIGNFTDNLVNIHQPTFKVRHSGVMHAESLDGEKYRPINVDEEQRLQPRRTLAPIRLQNALQAYHDLRDWEPYFDDLSYPLVVKSSQVRI